MKVLCVFGTRPEAIKFVSIIRALHDDGRFEPIICTTSQHRHLLEQVLSVFHLEPDFNLDIMKPNQDLFDVTSRVLMGMRGVLRCLRPDWVLVQGDTTTAFATALSSYYEKIRIGHIEAGLRTRLKYNPFPEELNRRTIAVYADAHFAPTPSARDNLLREDIPPDRIWVTGNTSIDTLQLMIDQLDKDKTYSQAVRSRLPFLNPRSKLVLVTAHRRESFGKSLEEICLAVQDLAIMNPDIQIVFPVHPNPNVQNTVKKILGDIQDPIQHIDNQSKQPPLSNLFLLSPLDYAAFVFLLSRAYLVLTDSGGIQEEAPSLGIPTLVMRSVTERTETAEIGIAKLIGTSRTAIVNHVQDLLGSSTTYASVAKPTDVYGDGRAADRICAALKKST